MRFVRGTVMKLTLHDINRIAKKTSDNLICTCGLKHAKKVAAQIKRNLLAEEKKRKGKQE